MLKAMNRAPKPAPAEAAGPTDDELMQAVAERRDVAAFEQLHRRYERAAYNLAVHLSGSRGGAEEAVQEAALLIWRQAEKYRPGGNFKGWFFTIVANCSRKVRYSQRREDQRAAHLGSHRLADEQQEAAEVAMKDKELSRALRDQMAKLDPIERSILALYYGAELNQREIGRTLNVPQTSVSMKIRDALGKLRAGLTSAGYAAATPLLEGGKLSDAVLNGEAVPDGLHGKIMQRLTEIAKHSVRTTAAGKSAFVFWASILACTTLATVAFIYSPSAEPRAVPPAPPVEAGKTPSIGALQSVPKQDKIGPRFSQKWTFDDASQLDELFGPGHGLGFVPEGGPDGNGCIDTKMDTALLRVKSLPKLRLPVRALWKERLIGTQTPARVLLGWSDDSILTFAAVRNAGAILNVPVRTAPWRRGAIYLSDHFYDLWLEGQRTAVEYLDLRANPQMVLAAKGRYLIDDLVIEEIGVDELPDLTEFKRLIDDIPAEKRSGRIDCPELKSARPGQQVFIEFLRSPALGAKDSPVR